MNKIAILDRDGVINQSQGWILKPSELTLEKDSGKAISALNSAGVKVVIATNQSPIGRGLISENDLHAIHEKMKHDLKTNYGAHIDAIYFSPDHPDRATNRRKPGNGMLLEALRDFNAEACYTPFIGDNIIDVQAAKKTGCPSHFVLTGHGSSLQERVKKEFPKTVIHKNLFYAVEWLLENHFE